MDDADLAMEAEQRFRERALAAQAQRTPRGPAAELCEDCGDSIPEERRRAVPGARRCVWCQALHERRV
jgi:phage/conjugal plasmid C-4 type zinc finger TraR family protein